MLAIEVGDEAAAQFNTKLVGTVIGRLTQLQPMDRQRALAECVPAISKFAMSLAGTRRNKISAWTSLDLAVQNRLKPNEVRAVALALTGRARRIMLSEGRCNQGERNAIRWYSRQLAKLCLPILRPAPRADRGCPQLFDLGPHAATRI